MKKLLVTAPTIVAGVLVAGAVWLLFAPAQLGGATRYAVVEGASMEPALSRGDLVLVRGGMSRRSGTRCSTAIPCSASASCIA